jgi:hypothetical protein
MLVSQYLSTRVIEAAAHGVDLAQALDVESWTTPAALELCLGVLRDLLAAPVPAAISAQRFFAIATGRATLSDGERSTLGSDASRFPLLS